MSLVEALIAMIVLMVGVTASMALAVLAIGSNGRNRQQSNSTAIARMVTEKISSVPASTSPSLTITDCTNTGFTVATAPGGPALLGTGDIDFSQAAPTNYNMNYTDCGTSGRQVTYDVRWNIVSVSAYLKRVTVSAKMRNAGSDIKYFSTPVTIRAQVGPGS